MANDTTMNTRYHIHTNTLTHTSMETSLAFEWTLEHTLAIGEWKLQPVFTKLLLSKMNAFSMQSSSSTSSSPSSSASLFSQSVSYAAFIHSFECSFHSVHAFIHWFSESVSQSLTQAVSDHWMFVQCLVAVPIWMNLK